MLVFFSQYVGSGKDSNHLPLKLTIKIPRNKHFEFLLQFPRKILSYVRPCVYLKTVAKYKMLLKNDIQENNFVSEFFLSGENSQWSLCTLI